MSYEMRNTTLANLLYSLLATQFNVTENCRAGYVTRFCDTIDRFYPRIKDCNAILKGNDCVITFYVDFDDAIFLNDAIKYNTIGFLLCTDLTCIPHEGVLIYKVKNITPGFSSYFHNLLFNGFNPLLMD